MEENKNLNEETIQELVEETSVDFSGDEAATETEEVEDAEITAATDEISNEGSSKEAPGFIRTGLTAVIVLAIFTVSYFVVSMFNQGEANKPAPTPTPRPETALTTVNKKANVKYTQKEALEIAQKAAKKQFGEDAFVVPVGEEEALEVEINGEKRFCYMFGADSASNLTNGASMRGLYHLDANTGEIFDNQNGEFKKVN